MGGRSSVPEAEEDAVGMPPMHYPDMNALFKSLPKMMQVADDMHRMTDYIMDLRNMTVGLVCMSILGIACFLVIRIAHSRRKDAQFTRFRNSFPQVSENMSLSVPSSRSVHRQGRRDEWAELRGKLSSSAHDTEKTPTFPKSPWSMVPIPEGGDPPYSPRQSLHASECIDPLHGPTGNPQNV